MIPGYFIVYSWFWGGIRRVWLKIFWMRFLVFYCSLWCWYGVFLIVQWELRVFLWLFLAFWKAHFLVSLRVFEGQIRDQCDLCFVEDFVFLGAVVCVWAVDFVYVFFFDYFIGIFSSVSFSAAPESLANHLVPMGLVSPRQFCNRQVDSLFPSLLQWRKCRLHCRIQLSS